MGSSQLGTVLLALYPLSLLNLPINRQKCRSIAISVVFESVATQTPEYGTVGSDQIKEAAKEAVRGLGYDLLIVCGFAFDPSVSEESKRFGKLTVLPTKMNPDLLLGDELLKKTSAANLFMVFGEPDIEFKRQDGQIVVTLQGLDIYDPTTGEIRSSSPDEIACWFIDTNWSLD
jgi:adenine-specific DNA-methyltransferase